MTLSVKMRLVYYTHHSHTEGVDKTLHNHVHVAERFVRPIYMYMHADTRQMINNYF